jgi:hypothetical protein
MLSVTLMLSVVNTECHMLALDAECCFAECRYAECCYAECRYAECCYAECRYDECRHTECHGAVFTTLYFLSNLRMSPIS